MVEIAGVEFPEALIAALRDGRLVIFAGAGVSMGQLAGLPDFEELACRISAGTDKNKEDSESTDRFLGRLKYDEIDVHSRAAKLLQKGKPKPTELHQNLLRIYPKREDIRIVTTNFDVLFEKAYNNLFEIAPKVFEATALPFGGRFQGIVHIHGSINDPQEMILTKQDFGRAYTTEANGWARQFLLDLFNNFFVLFIGYSHSDTIMNYMISSLGENNDKERYTMTGNHENDADRWRGSGVKPISFEQSQKNDYDKLYEALEGLANYIQISISNWQQKITSTKITPMSPPVNTKSDGTIKQASSKLEVVRFLKSETGPQDLIKLLHEDPYILDDWLAQHPPEIAQSLREFLTRRR